MTFGVGGCSTFGKGGRGIEGGGPRLGIGVVLVDLI